MFTDVSGRYIDGCSGGLEDHIHTGWVYSDGMLWPSTLAHGSNREGAGEGEVEGKREREHGSGGWFKSMKLNLTIAKLCEKKH